MGNNNKQVAPVFKPRKATFTAKVVKGKREFTAVNRRAHVIARKLGKRSKLSLAELRSTKGKGSYKLYVYNESGVLKPIKL